VVVVCAAVAGVGTTRAGTAAGFAVVDDNTEDFAVVVAVAVVVMLVDAGSVVAAASVVSAYVSLTGTATSISMTLSSVVAVNASVTGAVGSHAISALLVVPVCEAQATTTSRRTAIARAIIDFFMVFYLPIAI